jgi:hypothetical protein
MNGTLTQETIDALVELHNLDDDDPIIPAGLAGHGRRRSELTAEESELLCANEVELDDLFPEGVVRALAGEEEIVVDGGPSRRGWRYGKADDPDPYKITH